MGLQSPLLELHREAGAQVGDYFGAALPARFGDFPAEYRNATKTVAVVDTNLRAIFALTGPDRTRYLNAVTTGNIRDLQAGQSAPGLLLNAQGHILAELDTLALEDRLLVLGHAFVRERTAQTLDKFIIMDDAALSDETDATCTLAIEGPTAPAAFEQLTGLELGKLAPGEHREVAVGAAGARVFCRVWRHSLYGMTGVEFLAPRQSLFALWVALAGAARDQGGAPVGWETINSARLEAGVPWFGADFDEHSIPHEAGLEGTHISFTKGCYTGQEIVERVRSRGHVNRRLTGLRFESAEAPKAGTVLTAGGAETGHVTSGAFSPLLGKPIGLGYVRREYNAPGTALQFEGGPAEVITLPVERPSSAKA